MSEPTLRHCGGRAEHRRHVWSHADETFKCGGTKFHRGMPKSDPGLDSVERQHSRDAGRYVA